MMAFQSIAIIHDNIQWDLILPPRQPAKPITVSTSLGVKTNREENYFPVYLFHHRHRHHHFGWFWFLLRYFPVTSCRWNSPTLYMSVPSYFCLIFFQSFLFLINSPTEQQLGCSLCSNQGSESGRKSIPAGSVRVFSGCFLVFLPLCNPPTLRLPMVVEILLKFLKQETGKDKSTGR